MTPTKRTCAIALACLIAACAQPTLEAPAPRALEIAAPAASVTSAAAAALRALGWTVRYETADSLDAQRTASGDGNGAWMRCLGGVGATGDWRRVTRDLTSALVARVGTSAAEGRTSVRVSVVVDHAVSPLPPYDRGLLAYSSHTCVSNGALEAALVDSLAARFPVGGSAAVHPPRPAPPDPHEATSVPLTASP